MRTNPWAAEVKSGALTATFHGDGRMPKCAPDPAYPEGKDMDMTQGFPGCAVTLHQAPCCGTWIITCAVCNTAIGVTAAARPDDPRTIKIPCLIGGRA